MSQVLDSAADRLASDPAASEDVASHSAPDSPAFAENRPTPEPGGEFDYRPMPVLAPTAAVLAGCSLFAWWLLPALGIALVAVVVAGVATRKIATSEGELTGMRLAAGSLIVSGTLFVASTARHAYLVATEVPEGFTKVNFTHDIAKYGIGMRRGRVAVAEEVAKHIDQEIFIKGYMFPMEQTEGLTSFLLVKDNQLCCFGQQVQPTDMILVDLPEGVTFDYTTGMVSVGGTFRIDPSRRDDQEQTVVYKLDGKLVEKSKTIF